MISSIITSIREASGSNAKLTIIKDNASNETLRIAFEMTYKSSIRYYIRASKTNVFGNGVLTVEILNEICDKLSQRQVTGHAARDFLQSKIESLLPEEADVLVKIINRDLECKAAASTVNKVWPGTVVPAPFQLSHPLNEKTSKLFDGRKLIINKKYDGGRVAVRVNHAGDVSLITRGNNEVLVHGAFNFLSRYSGMVFDGEMVCKSATGIIDRKTSNGILNKGVRGTITPNEAKSLHLCLWDAIPLDKWEAGLDETPYEFRLQNLIDMEIPSHIASIADMEVIHTQEEAQAHFEKMLAAGEEGSMVKDANGKWIPDRVDYVLKMKAEKTCTLLCTGVQEHSKRQGQIGSLICESSDGNLKVRVGSGLTDKDRMRDDFVGKLIEVMYNQVIFDKNEATTHSLFLPRFIVERIDGEVDTLDKIKSQ